MPESTLRVLSQPEIGAADPLHALLHDSELAYAQCGTIRLKLRKIGARIRISVRRVCVCLSEAFPRAELFRQVLARIQAHPLYLSTA